MDPHLRRLAFVTAHYAELRGGVTRAAFAPLIILVGITGDLMDETLAFLLVFAATAVLTSAFLSRWMDQRFGRVVPASDQQGRVLLVAGLLFLFATRIDHVLDGAGPSILFLSASAFGLWLTVRLWPYGAVNLLPTLVAAVMAIEFAAVNSAEALLEWERRAWVSTLVAWTFAGLFDLTLLSTFLRARTDGVNAAAERM